MSEPETWNICPTDIEDWAVVGGKTVVRDKRGIWWERPFGRPGQWVRSARQSEAPQ